MHVEVGTIGYYDVDDRYGIMIDLAAIDSFVFESIQFQDVEDRNYYLLEGIGESYLRGIEDYIF